MHKGFVVLAQNTKDIDYVECAEVLATSLKNVMPDADITLISDDVTTSKIFDNVVKLPHGDLDPDGSWKLINDWQVYEASPYDYTIKLEADMYIPRSIDYYWDVLMQRDLVISHTIRNFKNEIVQDQIYRQFCIQNGLPSCYNALTYFKKSDTARQFFDIVRDIFENWESYKKILKCKITEQVTTDWAYSIASHIMGPDKTLMPVFTDFSMVHMKQHINDLMTEEWSKQLVYEFTSNGFKVNTFVQKYPFHYQDKKFVKSIK
jgi:hypothetical protein